MIKRIKLSKATFFVIIICVILFFIPFFWIKPGEVELGGDSSRLYLYDPLSYLKSDALYSIDPEGLGAVRPDQFLIPFLLLLHLIHSIFHSPYILVCLLNSIKLVGAFLFMYLVVFEISSNYVEKKRIPLLKLASIVSAIFYTVSPSVGENMNVALITHNQVFLNPLVFFLGIRFLVTKSGVYLFFLLLTTVVFSSNFSLKAPPPLFSFYPLALLFIGLYVMVCLKKTLPWKQLVFGGFLFLGLHSFHIIPVIAYILDPSSFYNQRVFDSTTSLNEGLNYFNAILRYGIVVNKIFYSYQFTEVIWTSFAPPLVIVLGLFLSKERQKTLFLVASFFFISLFLESANITKLGVEAYRRLFAIPGFSMFRNFYGQWQWLYSFFYSIFFGLTLYIVLSRLKSFVAYSIILTLIGLSVINGWKFLNGDFLQRTHFGSNITSVFKIDPDFEETLSFLKKSQVDGKVVSFPFTDYVYQLVRGENNGAYIGPSPISYLTEKKNFSGYQTIYPFPNVFLQLLKEKNYDAVGQLLGILNVRYVFHDQSTRAYVKSFPSYPFTLFRESIPGSNTLAELVGTISGDKIFRKGEYSIYDLDPNFYLPHFYIPTSFISYDKKNDWFGKNVSFFINKKTKDPRVGYFERDNCIYFFSEKECKKNIFSAEKIPNFSYERVNPIKYKIKVSNATGPFVLIFSDQFHTDWKAYTLKDDSEKIPVQKSYFNGEIREGYHKSIFLNSKTFETFGINSIAEEQHSVVNGYASAWQIKSQDIPGKDFVIVVEMIQQNFFYYGLVISLISLGVLVLYGLKLLVKQYRF